MLGRFSYLSFTFSSFIGSRGPNCTKDDTVPSSQPFVIDQSTISSSSTQSNFTAISDGDSLTCIVPPNGGDYWPYGGNPEGSSTNSSSGSGGSSAGKKAGLAIGIIAGIIFVGVLSWFIRRWAIARQRTRPQRTPAGDRMGFVRRDF